MTTDNAIQTTKEWKAFNYCVSFIDLLGQRDAMKGRGLLPLFGIKGARLNFFNRYIQ